MDTLSEEELRTCRRGGAAALGVLFHRFGNQIFRTALGILGRREDAEDATQEVLLHLCEKMRTFEGTASPWTWIYRITVNQCLNWKRKHRSRSTSLEHAEEERLPAEDAAGPLEVASRREDRERLHRRLEALDPDARTILVLRELEELSYQQIAAVLEVPVGTVMSRLSRARARLEQGWGMAPEARRVRT